jgi:hypothetical protein
MPLPWCLCILARQRRPPCLTRCNARQKLHRKLLVASLAVSAACVSCGTVGQGSTPAATPSPSVTVQPSSAQVVAGLAKQFSAVVLNASNPSVKWMVNQTPGGDSTVGTVTSSGYYTAPSQVPSGPVTVTALLQSDPSVNASATVSIQGSLNISPARMGVTTSQTLRFQLASGGLNPNDVTWTVSGGAISASGLYTPSGAPGAYTVTATLNANPNVQGQATVYVTDLQGVPTWRNDNARSGTNSQELALSPSTVSPNTFGRLFSCPVDGYVYAQPLYAANLLIPGSGMHNVVFVATEKDSVYAFDADTAPCIQLWKTSPIPQGEQVVEVPSLQIPNTLIGPFIGITGTPVVDLSGSLLYTVAATQTAALNPTYDHHLYALDLATGKITQSASSFDFLNGQFDSTVQLQRSALLLDNGSLYVAFGSNGAPGNYHGWLFKFVLPSLQSPEAFSVTPLPVYSGVGGGGIWQSGGGPSADTKNHNVFVVTGDGPFNVHQGSLSYSDSFLQFGPSTIASVSDYFTPCDQSADQTNRDDVGASAPLLLPDAAGTVSQPHLLIGGSKGGSLYVVNRDSMGNFKLTGCPDSTPVVQTVPLSGPIFSTPLYWNGAAYVAPGNGNLLSLPMLQGILSSSAISKSVMPLGPQGATPALSWNAASKDLSTAVLWLIDTTGALASTPGPAILRAYNPTDLSNELYDSTMAPNNRDQAGLAVKFTVPTVANGKVYVGTQNELDVYGLLP